MIISKVDVQGKVLINSLDHEIIVDRNPSSFVSVGTLGFYLNGVAYHNGSTVRRSDIGEGDNVLQCTTESTTCCSNLPPEMRAGEFYMPDGSVVPTSGETRLNGYYRTRGSRHIALNRRSTGTITGLFQCEIPDARQITVRLLINIGECY
jgi:hypothetical protein